MDIMAVTKSRSKEEILELMEKRGIKIIGENKLQEIEKKYDSKLFLELKKRGVELHFIGHLQKNKVKKVVRLCECIQSVGSVELGKLIAKEAQAQQKRMPIFLEVNLSGEIQKCGFREEELKNSSQELQQCPYLIIRGLMTIGKEGDSEKTRQIFRRCKELTDSLDLQECSMGMSDDYPIAIEEGTTMLRLGRALFELRKE